MFWQRIDYLQHRLKIFEISISSQDYPELRQEADASIPDICICIFKDDLFQFILDLLENLQKLLRMLSSTILCQEALDNDDLNTINDKLLDSGILMT